MPCRHGVQPSLAACCGPAVAAHCSAALPPVQSGSSRRRLDPPAERRPCFASLNFGRPASQAQPRLVRRTRPRQAPAARSQLTEAERDSQTRGPYQLKAPRGGGTGSRTGGGLQLDLAAMTQLASTPAYDLFTSGIIQNAQVQNKITPMSAA